MGRQSEAEKAGLLLAAARYLNETLEPGRVYDRFHELLTDAVPHAGVVVSSFDAETGLISCEYAWVDGEKLDPAFLPPLPLNREGGGMQSRVIVGGEPLLVNDVPEQVKQPGGVYYDVDREGKLRKVPEEGVPGVRAAMMLPVKLEGEVVGVVQLHNADALPFLPHEACDRVPDIARGDHREGLIERLQEAWEHAGVARRANIPRRVLAHTAPP